MLGEPRAPRGRRLVVLPAVLLFAILAACGSDGDKADDADEAASTPTGEDSPATTEAAPDVLRSCAAVTESTDQRANLGGVVDMIDFEFCQADLTVEAGQVIEFVNRGGARHQVKQTEVDDGVSSEVLEPGQAYVLALDEPGTFTYVCAFHSQMTGRITVT